VLLDQPLSVTVVFGDRWAVPFVTYRPLMAERYALPDPPLRPDASTTLVRGCLAADALEMYLPEIALRARPPELRPLAIVVLLRTSCGSFIE
jgi:hypothetical protein